MAKLFTYISLLFCCSILACAQPKPTLPSAPESNYVWLMLSKNTVQCFCSQLRPAFENKNGFVNASVVSDSGDVFEINGIPSAWLRDTTIKQSKVQVVLIRKTGGSWVSDPDKTPVKLTITNASAEPGSQLILSIQTTLYQDKRSIQAEARLIGQVPTRQDIQIQRQ